MARPCTVCQHRQRAAIDGALIGDESNRRIAARFGVPETSLRRHKAEHLPRVLAAGAEATEPAHAPELIAQAARGAATAREHAIDVFAELERAVERANLLSDACDRWLRDPDDPTRYSVGARAEDVVVIYTAYSAGGKPKKAPLSELLHAVEKYARIEAVEIKSADPRELILKAHAAVKGQLELLATVLEKLHGSRQMQAFEAAVLAAIAETAPDVRDRIIADLESNQRLRALTGWRPAPGDGDLFV